MFCIAGFIGPASGASAKARVERMVSLVVHSGSSSSILVVATMPLDKTGKLGISFNGEIFNYLERRGELAAKGVYLTRSDTEATLQPYKTG